MSGKFNRNINVTRSIVKVLIAFAVMMLYLFFRSNYGKSFFIYSVLFIIISIYFLYRIVESLIKESIFIGVGGVGWSRVYKKENPQTYWFSVVTLLITFIFLLVVTIYTTLKLF